MSVRKVERVNEAIAIPLDCLESKDGRQFLIKEWAPKVRVGEEIEISITVVVKMPDGGIASP